MSTKHTDTIKKMEKYVRLTPDRIPSTYSMTYLEYNSVKALMCEDPFKDITLAFEYGQAKGFRFARKAAKSANPA